MVLLTAPIVPGEENSGAAPILTLHTLCSRWKYDHQWYQLSGRSEGSESSHWRLPMGHCLTDGFVLGAVTLVPGVVVVGAGPDVDVIATASGASLISFVDSHSGSSFDGPASISKGVLYIPLLC